MSKEVTVYMCEIDWDHEIGEAKGGTRFYASIKDLKENYDCWEECGIVEVKVKLSKTITT